jgi:YhhN-like protein.
MDQSTIALVATGAVSAALAVAFMAIRVTQKPIYGLLSKTLASMAFVAMGAVGVLLGGNIYAALILLGLSFGMVGDIVLDLKRAHSEFENQYLMSGMLAFMSGHGAYLSAFILTALKIGVHDLIFAGIVSGAIGLVAGPAIVIVAIKMMKANFGKFLGISVFYSVLLTFMSAFSIWLAILNPKFLLVAIAMAAFLLSDMVLSTMYFVAGKKEDKLLVVVNHTLYYAAQILLAAWLFV